MEALVLAEHRAGRPEPVTHQLVQQARGLAAGAGGVGLLLLCGPGGGIAQHLRVAGADAVYVVEDGALDSFNPQAWAFVTAEAVRRLRPAVLLCGHTFQGMEVAPWVAATLGLPLLSNCSALRRDGERFVGERPVYGMAWQALQSVPAATTVVASMARQGAPARAEAPPAPVETLEIDVPALGIETSVVESLSPQETEADITRADVVVGVGRGIKDPANLALMEDLAQALGGVVACSRPLVDLEWMPHERQVGASGREITPRVYIACGISGAAQHVAGIRGAGTIIAINQDAKAPLFGLAHYGVVGDLFQVVPALTDEARRRRSANE